MRGVRNRMDTPALFGVWPCRGFVQWCIAQISGGGSVGLVAVRAGAMGIDGRAVRIVQPVRGGFWGVDV
jgi:spore maturation protein SpmB